MNEMRLPLESVRWGKVLF